MGEQRRTVIIKNAFQQRVIMQTLVTTFTVLNGVIILGFLLSDTALPGYSRTSLALTIASLEVVGLGITYYISRQLSFHIAGPVYAIERSLKHFSDGDLTLHLTLRKGDYFFEVSDVVNETIDNFHRHIEQAQQTTAELKEAIDDGHAAAPLVKQLADELAYFTTDANPLQRKPPDEE